MDVLAFFNKLRLVILFSGLLLGFTACDRPSITGNGNVDSPDANELGNGSTSNPTGTSNPIGSNPSNSTTSSSAPTITLTANGVEKNLVVAAGASVKVEWTSQNTNQCLITEQVGADGITQPQSWGGPVTGSQTMVPTDQTTLTATCSNVAGQSASAQMVIYVTPTCVAKTVATPLTTTVINNAPNQLVQYQISYTSCTGQPLPFPVDQIEFDDNGVDWSSTFSLPYSISGTGVSLQGTMSSVFGTDLFGHTSACTNAYQNINPCYFHFVTDQTVTVPAGVDSFVFTVDLSYTMTHAYDTDPNNPPPVETISTYLAFGDAQPAVAPINFTNP